MRDELRKSMTELMRLKCDISSVVHTPTGSATRTALTLQLVDVTK